MHILRDSPDTVPKNAQNEPSGIRIALSKDESIPLPDEILRKYFLGPGDEFIIEPQKDRMILHIVAPRPEDWYKKLDEKGYRTDMTPKELDDFSNVLDP